MDEDALFICLYRKGGRIYARATSNENDFPEEIDPSTAASANNIEPNSNNVSVSLFRSHFKSYTSIFLSYVDMLPMLASLSPSISRHFLLQKIEDLLSQKGTLVDSSENRHVYRLPFQHYSDYRSLDLQSRTADVVSNEVQNMLLIGIIGTLDHYIAMVIREILTYKPHNYLKYDRNIPIRGVLNYNSIDELKSQLLDKEVDSVMRESFESQIRRFEEILDIPKPISSGFRDWLQLVELYERRNLFAHANGIVNKIYKKRCTEMGVANAEQITIGTRINADPKYFRKGIEISSEFGAKLIQVAWRKVAPDDRQEADRVLGVYGYDLLERGEYSMASEILQFACSLDGKMDESQRRMNVVNMANCFRLLGENEKMNKCLDAEDWSAVSDLFKISIAAIRGEVEETIRLMANSAFDSGNFDPEQFETWPAFYGVRDDTRFAKAFEDRYGRSFVPAPQVRHTVAQQVFLEEPQKLSNTRN